MGLLWRVLICLFLGGCCSQKGWIYHNVVSDFPQFDSAILMHVPPDTFRGIEVQFLRGDFGCIGYLSVYCRQIPSSNVVIQIPRLKEEKHFQGILMEGRQKIQLPEEATCLILEALACGETVIICLEGYKSELHPENFNTQYKKFTKNPSCVKNLS